MSYETNSYVTLTGERIDLSALTDPERRFLGEVVRAYQAGEAYPNFVNRAHAPGSPALAGGEWVTPEVLAAPLYRVCADLADRLGVAQGFLALGENSSEKRAGFEGEKDANLLSSQEAADLVGVSAEAIRKAIRQERIPARQVGRTYLIDRRALESYHRRSRKAPRPNASGAVRAKSD